MAAQLKTEKAILALTDQKFGDWVEGVVQDELDGLMRAGPFFYQRLYDTRSAGGFLPKQPGDFMGVCHGVPWLLEVKATSKYASLSSTGALKGLVKDHQALGSHLMNRAGGQGLFLFCSRLSNQVELWDGSAVRKVYIASRVPLRHGLLATVTVANMTQAPAAIRQLLSQINTLIPKDQP